MRNLVSRNCQLTERKVVEGGQKRQRLGSQWSRFLEPILLLHAIFSGCVDALRVWLVSILLCACFLVVVWLLLLELLF